VPPELAQRSPWLPLGVVVPLLPHAAALAATVTAHANARVRVRTAWAPKKELPSVRCEAIEPAERRMRRSSDGQREEQLIGYGNIGGWSDDEQLKIAVDALVATMPLRTFARCTRL
jgi:hypothetical protein